VLVADTVPFSCVDGPGNRFVVFLQGCNFDCLACHNPQTIPLSVPHARHVAIDELVAEVRSAAPFLSGVTVSGGEPTLQWPAVREWFAALKADAELGRLTTLVDTNASAERGVWDGLAPVMDGAMVDLKCLDPDRHRELTGQPNDNVLASIRHLARIGRLAEVRLLVIPGQTDDQDLLTRTGKWLADVDPSVRVLVQGFRRHGARAAAQAWREGTLHDLEAAAAVLVQSGLSDVRVRGTSVLPA
jgi:pyruvate formate lyase activating enzyme